MLSPGEFHDQYPPEDLADELPDEPVASLRDLQYLYGKLYTLATAGGGEYAAYLTPDQASDLFGEPESVIAMQVDLSGEEPRLHPEEPIYVTSYGEALVEQLAHCKFNAARGIDHSVTHRSGRDSSKEKLARYAKERLTRWATDDVVQEVAADREDGWIIDGLVELGKNDSALERIGTAVDERLGGSRTALLTVRVKLEPDGEYRWPGDDELRVFDEAMRARKLSKLVSKGEATDSAGEATDYVSGRRARTVGTAEDPLNYFLGKQMEKFPGLDPDEAWRSHPVSEDAAVTLMNAETFVDACTYRIFGATVYYLPYFVGKTTPDRAYRLYNWLYTASQQTDGSERLTPIEQAYETLDDPELEPRLRFYVAAVMKHQSKRFDVFGDTMNGSILHPSELAKAHENVLDRWVFSGDSGGRLTPPMPTSEEWPLLSGEKFLRLVSTGSYFYTTFRFGDDDTDATADDFRIEALVSALSGNQIPVDALLETYVARLLEDDSEGFPSFLVASQFAQLSALARAELLDGRGRLEPITNSPAFDTMTQRAHADGGAVERANKVESFIEDTPALQHEERRAVYLLGALVGAVGSYQQYAEGRSTTLVDQFPVKSLSRTRIKKVTEETIDKTLTYTRQENRSITKYEWIVNPLRKTILQGDPDETWEIDTDDLRFYYALGVTYGMNDRPDGDDATDTNATEETA